jgi:hypothetical protein
MAVKGEEGRELTLPYCSLGVRLGDELLELVLVEAAGEVEDRSGGGGDGDAVDVADFTRPELADPVDPDAPAPHVAGGAHLDGGGVRWQREEVE